MKNEVFDRIFITVACYCLRQFFWLKSVKFNFRLKFNHNGLETTQGENIAQFTKCFNAIASIPFLVINALCHVAFWLNNALGNLPKAFC